MSQPALTRKSGLAPSTIRTRYNYVHMALRAAVVDRIIRADPSAGIALPRTRKSSAAMTIPTTEDVGRALSVASVWFRPFVAVCAFAGLRLGEAAGLHLADVDFLRRTVSVQRQVQGETAATSAAVAPKYGSERVVYVPTELLAILAEHVGRLGIGPIEWLIPNGDRPFNRNSAGEQWRRIRAAAGLTTLTLHDLRHFYASGLIASGCDVVTVQRALGHSSATITLGVYSHLWPTAEDQTRAAAGDLMAALRICAGSAVVVELQRDVEILSPQQLLDRLQVIALLAADPQLVALDLGLHSLRTLVPDDLRDLLGLVRGDALLDRCGDLVGLAGCLRLAGVEGLQREAAFDQLLLEDVEGGGDPLLRVGLQGHALLTGPRDGRVGAAEVETLRELLARLVQGVVDLLAVDLADDVEGRIGHGALLSCGGPE